MEERVLGGRAAAPGGKRSYSHWEDSPRNQGPRSAAFAIMRFRVLLGVAVMGGCALAQAVAPSSIPILVDTDIGTDIDDAFALALIVKSPEFKVVGVTTVAGDTQARARLAAKLLAAAGGNWRDVPVYAGHPGPAQEIDQASWAEGYSSPALHLDGAVDFLHREIARSPGQLTIVALGELTNIAALLHSDPSTGPKIKQIVLMGGSVFRGYTPDSKPVAEWNFKSNPAAAEAVFAAGIPILMVPLDATTGLKFRAPQRARLFARGEPIARALRDLYALWLPTDKWNHGDPILYDALPVALLLDDRLATLRQLEIEVDDTGSTLLASKAGQMKCTVATDADPAVFVRFYERRLER